jgi:hypothetical protein
MPKIRNLRFLIILFAVLFSFQTVHILNAKADENEIAASDLKSGDDAIPDFVSPGDTIANNKPSPISVSSASDSYSDLQEENARLRTALEKERRMYENRFMTESRDSSSNAEMEEKLRLLEIKNKELEYQLSSEIAKAKPVSLKEDSVSCQFSEEDLNKANERFANLRAENDKLRIEAKKALRADVNNADIMKLKEENQRLLTQIAQLEVREGNASKSLLELKEKNLQLITQLENKANSGDKEQLSMLRKQNDQLTKELDNLKFDAEKNINIKDQEIGALKKQNLRLVEDLNLKIEETGKVDQSLKRRFDALAEENRKLRADLNNQAAELGRLNEEKEEDTLMVSKLRSSEDELAFLKSENQDLEDLLASYRKKDEEKLVKLSSSNWDLEKATRRFNEAEREIRRLGERLEEEQSICQREKREIEYMLFDPEIAKKEQVEALTRLEKKLNKAQIDLKRQKNTYEDRISYLENKLEEKGSVMTGRNELTPIARTVPVAPIQAIPPNQSNYETKSISMIDSAERQRLIEKIKQLEQDKLAMEQEVLKSGSKDYVAIQQMSDEINRLRLENEKLASVDQNDQTALRQMGDEINRLKLENERLASIDQNDQLVLKQMSDELARLKFEKDKLESISRTDLTQQAEINRLRDQISRLEQDKKNLSISLSEIEMASLNNSPQPLSNDQSTYVSQEPTVNNFVPTNESVSPEADIAPAAGGLEQDVSYDVSSNYEEFRQDVSYTQDTTETVPDKRFMTSSDLGAVLEIAGIVIQRSIQQIEADTGITVYSWNTGALYGSAEQSIISNLGKYDAMVTKYLGNTEERCPGDFAAVPGMEKQYGAMRASSYEVACVGDDVSASVSILFFTKDGVFTAISHETTAENMELAMDTRDRLFGVFTNDSSMSQ